MASPQQTALLRLPHLLLADAAHPTAHKAVSTRERKVAFQSFLICFFTFFVAIIFALAGFVPVPLSMVKLSTISLQLCSGTSYLPYNLLLSPN